MVIYKKDFNVECSYLNLVYTEDVGHPSFSCWCNANANVHSCVKVPLFCIGYLLGKPRPDV